jgi:hypothetical protein
MAQRRFHYELAFEHYLRANKIPYVAVDEAKRALAGGPRSLSLKSFDFVVYSKSTPNLLVDVKGRKHAVKTNGSARSLQNWVTEEDVESMLEWEKVFGHGFLGAFAFLYDCQTPPPDALFQENFEHGDHWYSLMAVRLDDYRKHMKPRSAKWKTVSIPAKDFARITVPLKQLL